MMLPKLLKYKITCIILCPIQKKNTMKTNIKILPFTWQVYFSIITYKVMNNPYYKFLS